LLAGHCMPATFFIVRSVVEPHLREKLEHWYANDHLPWALRVFKCEKAWRCWSATDAGVHYAVYRFTDKASCDAALGSPEYKEMVADYDRAFPSVLRTRDVVTLVDERNV
jgi:hypothetical protein